MDRKFLSTSQFFDLLRTVKTPEAIDNSKIAVLLSLPTEVKALGGKDSRLIQFKITSDRVDRDQDILNPDGWDFADFQANPVVLWAHDHEGMPVGRSKSLTRVANTWESICEFTPEDLNPFGYMCYRMYAEGFLNATSVGFMPQEYNIAADRKYGINYNKQSLLEYSCVPVPSNADALAVARSKGINTAPLTNWAAKVLDEARQKGLPDDARSRVEAMWAASSPSGRALMLEMEGTKMAVTETDKTAQAPTAVKQAVRWECGTKGHLHESEQEAKSCSDFDTAVLDATKGLQQIQNLVKSGSTLRPEAGALIRSIVDELVPLTPAKTGEGERSTESEPALDVEDDEETTGLEGVTEDQLRSALTDVVKAEIKQALGQVD